MLCKYSITGITRDSRCCVNTVLLVSLGVSISLIFPLPNHPSQIFFRDIPNDAKKSLRPLGHMRPVGSVSQVKIDGPWNQKIYI